MKLYLKLLYVVLLSALSFTLVSCGDDDEDNASLIGVWETAWSEDGESFQFMWTFNRDNKFTFDYSQSDGFATVTAQINGVYTLSGDLSQGATLVMTGSYPLGSAGSESGMYNETFICVIKNKALYVTDDTGMTLVFTRK